ncbi:MAG TPA: ribonucleotide-diphosphate reductase subunit alpha [Firmicutes bacterium]|jgi:ribonucleoside-diphosphate reductase alpha chain|nr:ribonucleotide-diphosphate reductase subunit alpha [Bacillota bacterium]HAZ22781.1 ribonucleotide-diphosphate reductase subunit alpha [Bacillota bacterium]HBR24129.1 ribonucleotide-diphosphate reductase subunit alpha [Bacillota bacterium]HCX70210.1 ribonucleotide-diphosphate reductase subunit alpha [Bacillota bacterium]
MVGSQKNKAFRAIELTDNARTILEKRYLKREGYKVIERPEDMFLRVAQTIAVVDQDLYGCDANATEELTRQFYDLFVDKKFMPNSPTLMGAGRELGQLSACFVLPVDDSMEGIFDTLKAAALIHQSGGGTGFSFSRLRPKDDIVKSTGGLASGPLSFIKVYNSATEAVKQGGTRRGANMGVLRVDHPDIQEFLELKKTEGEIANFNLSVAITDSFMEAVAAGESYELINPRSGKVAKTLDAREVFRKIAGMAWSNGEPGLIFIDKMNADNPTPAIGMIESTNPCGEQPLLPYESCNLGSINLGVFVSAQKDGQAQAAVDYKSLAETIHLAVHFLDNVIDASKFPLPEIERVTKSNRKIGLGVMGFADLLVRLGIPYDSDQAEQTAIEVMRFIHSEGVKESQRLAELRGAFPNFAGSIFDLPGQKPMRNATITTVAPTGTISSIAGCSSGIEPYFALAYERHVLSGETLIEIVPLLGESLLKEGLDQEKILKQVALTGSLRSNDDVPDALADLFKTSLEIPPERHLAVQAAFQQYTDNAVSKTINLPNETTVDQVEDILMQSYQSGCKGITVYRDGSRAEQVLSAGIGQSGNQEAGTDTGKPGDNVTHPRSRPDVLIGTTQKFKIGCGNLYVTVNSDDMGITEVFTNTGRAGGCASQSEATSRLISIALRSGVATDAIIEQIRGIRCPACIRRDGVNVTSCPDAIARALQSVVQAPAAVRVAQNEQAASVNATAATQHFGQCPECGEPMIMESGCHICKSCGYSKCG